eukprot:CAMPEP_0206470196 /NCGR_PEP_ID=MMETSP0324_2-20121206/30775_1 /ASSEMBLY_ACC=CAM_ASM_000836 /TAXON_ID=2866 /ORGANISM="Crypthecodinium cohnii, Strain Seligo" /LENGTH=643 /DNA_ID=CAMNT_0053944187 /DNA_START=104 /DNA_END=2036 /DNA_ORIENTATION=-
MGGASSWYSILSISAFLVSIWIASKVSRTIGISSIVLEISVGLILSPNALDFLPHEYSVCYAETITDCETHHEKLEIAEEGVDHCDLQAYLDAGKYASSWQDGFFGESSVTIKGHTYDLTEAGSSDRRLALGRPVLPPAPQRRLSTDSAEGKVDYDNYEQCLLKRCELELANECAHTPNILTLIGHTGVAMMIFESGMHFDFEQAKLSAVALLGTILPLVTGLGVVMAFGFDFENGFAAGTALAPTSVGIALRLLHEAKSLQTFFGQAIITAAFVDDILSLILYNILFSLQGDMTFMTFLPLILGIVFMIIAAGPGAQLAPKALAKAFELIPEYKGGSKLTTHHEALFMIMVVVLVAYAQITHLCGTHLWGCFIAGMCFAMWKEAHHVWVRQTKRLTVWMIRVFFAATVAFAIPVSDLLSWEAFLKGAVLGIGPCILTKVCCAFFMGDARFVIGWAMVGRAEFAYLIAQMAAASNMMEPFVFSIVIWALLWATVFAPFIFRAVLARYIRKKASELGADEETRSRADSLENPEPNFQRSSLSTGHLPDLYDEEQVQARRLEKVKNASTKEENKELSARIQVMTEKEKDLKAQVKALEELLQNQGDLRVDNDGATASPEASPTVIGSAEGSPDAIGDDDNDTVKV